MTLEITGLEELRATIEKWRGEGVSIALVPTMGALHDGHLALMKRAQELADKVVVSIFVNPTQFGPNEDFHKYPRKLSDDLAKLTAAGVDAAWIPSVETMYPDGPAATLHIEDMPEVMDATARPGHFDGVATVVARLFEQVRPNIAIFGEKDYQQLLLIKRLVNKLDMGINIVGVPVQREPDGLAMSSRNRYLSKQERAVAPALYESLQKAARGLTSGRKVKEVLRTQKETLAARGFDVEYFDLRHAETLETLYEYKGPARLFVAAKLGNTRLIDTIAVE